MRTQEHNESQDDQPIGHTNSELPLTLQNGQVTKHANSELFLALQDEQPIEPTKSDSSFSPLDEQPAVQTHTERNNSIRTLPGISWTVTFHSLISGISSHQPLQLSFWKESFHPPVSDVSGLESISSLGKWLVLGTLIGITSGVGAIVLSLAINIATNLFLRDIIGYFPPEARGDGITQLTPIAHLWFLPVVTLLGGLLSGLLVFKFAPDAEGHGTDAVIDAIHFKNGQIGARVPIVKLIASAITIGSGGSSGREGPVAQIGAGLSSVLGKVLHLSPKDRRIAVTIGMGAGIGAIFKAPFGGALLAAEILYLRDLEIEVFIPAIIASTVGYTVYGFFFGFTPIFGNLQIPAIGSPIQFLYYAVLGLGAGFVGVCYANSFYGINKLFHHLKLPKWIKPAIGGLIVGFIGLVFPQALGISYGWVQLFMNSKFLLSMPLWILLCLPFAKILATSLSIGSGGAGGTHGPGMVTGGFLGAFLWSIMHTLPFMPQQPAAFVIVGMMALFGAVAHTPIAVMVMLAEMTGNLSLLAPAMIALSISITILGNNTIFRSQLPNRTHAPKHKQTE